jgi:DNA polymerase
MTDDVADGNDRLAALRGDAVSCRAWPLWKNATQTVLGEGPIPAALMFVGEQPGDREDQTGRPFVGPAGQLFDKAIEQAGLDRAKTYVTNAVKHFKHEPRGKRRLHKRPNAGEIKACRRWLVGEIEVVRPRLVVALGATAAQSLAERPIPIQVNRRKVLEGANGWQIFITIHPSSLLRLPGESGRREAYEAFVADLKTLKEAARLSSAPRPPVSEL